MESIEFHHAAALLAWQLELGADEAICDSGVNRYDLPSAQSKAKAAAEAKAKAQSEAVAGPVAMPEIDVVGIARAASAQAASLDELRAAMVGFEHCELKKGARNLVFAQGNPEARVMIVGEAPDRDEDREGRAFVGAAGQLLDQMCAAIGMGRAGALAPVYVTSVLPWRPPQDRDPRPEEIAMLRPFLERHIALVAPDVVVVMGNFAAQAVLGKRGITRLRGDWAEALGRPIMPMLPPKQLMRNPLAKRDAWADLLQIQAKLQE